MNYKQIYIDLLAKVKAELPVYHRHIGSGLDGFYDAEYKYIVIDAKLKETKRGVQALAHEWTHYKDYTEGRFKEFFKVKKKKYTEERMKEVIDAEQSAGRGASKICLSYGKKYYPEELHPKKLLPLLAFWREFYFDK